MKKNNPSPRFLILFTLIGVGIGMLLCSLAHADDSYASLASIQEAVSQRVIVKNTWLAKDYRYIPEGETVWGNCSTFAATALLETMMAGLPAEYQICRTTKGIPHVYVRSGEWALDARYKTPVPVAQVACVPIQE